MWLKEEIGLSAEFEKAQGVVDNYLKYVKKKVNKN
jgi:hypothetical protein